MAEQFWVLAVMMGAWAPASPSAAALAVSRLAPAVAVVDIAAVATAVTQMK